MRYLFRSPARKILLKRSLGLTLMLVLALTSCTSSMQDSAPSAPSSSAAPSPADLTSTVAEVVSAVAEHRPQLTENFDDFRTNRCSGVLSSGQTGIGAAACVGSKIALGSYAKALNITLESLKPWPSEIESLTQQTTERLKTVAYTSEMDDSRMFDTAALLLNSKLQGWDPYL